MSEVYQINYEDGASYDAAGDTQSALAASVQKEVTEFLDSMDGQPLDNVYQMVLAQVEVPLLEAVLKKTHNNQSKCAQILGLNRGTLRKKLKIYGML